MHSTGRLAIGRRHERGARGKRPATSGLSGTADAILSALPNPVLMIGSDGMVRFANVAAEAFFRASTTLLCRHRLDQIVPFSSPLLSLVEQVRKTAAPINEYSVDVGTPRTGGQRTVDLQVAPVPELPDAVLIMLQPRTMAQKIDRQLTHRGAARSVSGMAAMLAHEIKNPLSGIRGAAQLLETAVDDSDRALTRLICDESDRVCALVDQMEHFSDERPLEIEPVNIHVVLDYVKSIAASGFAKDIKITEDYDPSLPPVPGNRDLLVQTFLNLVKNAAEAITLDGGDGEIVFLDRLQARHTADRAGLGRARHLAFGMLYPRYRARSARRSQAAPVRSVRYDQDRRQRAWPCAGGQGCARSWRRDRVRDGGQGNGVPHSVTHVSGGGGS